MTYLWTFETCTALDTLRLPGTLVAEFGHIVVHIGRLESSAYWIAQLLAVPDPALLPLATALRRARQQAYVGMPPWARVERQLVTTWVNEMLAFIPRRNELLHWAIERVQWPGDRESGLWLIDPHEPMTGVEFSNELLSGLHRTADGLEGRAATLIEGLCCDDDNYGLIDPMASLDGLGSGDLGFYLGINDDWPESQPRKVRGRGRPPRRT